MTTGGTAGLVRRLDGSSRATLLELLFDVVFVAALAQTSKLLADQESWAQGAAVMLMLTAIWWTWSVTSTTTEFYDPQQRPIQVILMVAMVGSVVMAASLPMITGAQAATFALAYVGTHVVRGIVLLGTLYRQQHRSTLARAARFLFWFLVSGVLWIVGALTDSGRWWFWSIAIAIDLISAAARYPTPGLGRVPLDQYDRTTAHLGERYQQFVILALGDIILVPTLELSRSEFDGLRITALICGFVIMLLLWQVYIFRAGELLETAAAAVPGRSTRIAPYTHLVLLIGVAVTAASFDLVVDRPTGSTPVRWLTLIIGGPMLFVLGRVLFTYLLSARMPWRQAACPLLPLLLLPWAGGWPPVLVSAVVALGLAGHVLIPGGGRETTRGLGPRPAVG
ncbi:low temperature requirement protein A [Micromonospora sp. CPCC 205558]|uniref:low temperature requirement protein A n=1 Tax=Micromonospora sp. CPCC 205558 TaxID=3122403 RepID=UPI002FF21E57